MKFGVLRGAALALMAFLAWCPGAAAVDYLLGNEDVISVSVYLHPELERTLSVNAEGNITFPPIGEIKAAGFTPKQLGDRISDRLSSYLRQTTAVTVTVTQYLSRSVYVTGAVAKPGRYGFERIPGLIDLISQAGGATTGADLTRVEILRREGEVRRVLTADIAAALREGGAATLPEVKPGDTVSIPGGIPGVIGGTGEGAAIIGEVNRPGLYPVGTGQDLWTALAVAGGPSTRANLKKVKIVSRASGSPVVLTLDLKKAMDRPSRIEMIIKSGDVVYVTPNATSGFGVAFNSFQTLLNLTVSVIQTVAIVDALNNP